MALHGEKGLAGVTVRAIAQRAGISTGAVYSHFSSLSELAQSLWQAPLAKANARLAEVAAAEPDPCRRIERLLGAYVDFALENPDFLRGAMLFVRPTTSDAPEPQPLESLEFFRHLLAAISDAQAEGRAREGDPRTLALGAWAAVHGALALPVNLDRLDFDSPRAVTDAAIATAVSALAR